MIFLIELANRALARAVSWCLVAMMGAQMCVVVARYVFGTGTVALQEAVVFGHALVFLLASAWVLRCNAHVRIDVVFSRLPARWQRRVNLAALIGFVLPVALVIAWYAYPYVAHAVAALEGSRQPGGLGGVYLLKAAMIVFALTVGLQALATAARLAGAGADRHWSAGNDAGTVPGPDAGERR